MIPYIEPSTKQLFIPLYSLRDIEKSLFPVFFPAVLPVQPMFVIELQITRLVDSLVCRSASGHVVVKECPFLIPRVNSKSSEVPNRNLKLSPLNVLLIQISDSSAVIIDLSPPNWTHFRVILGLPLEKGEELSSAVWFCAISIQRPPNQLQPRNKSDGLNDGWCPDLYHSFLLHEMDC